MIGTAFTGGRFLRAVNNRSSHTCRARADRCMDKEARSSDVPARSYSSPVRAWAEGEAQGLTMKSQEQTKETKTAKELEAMILEDLRNVVGCPERGVTVTVYGIPWNAMLTFGAAAGPVRNKAELKKFFETITERLQRLYDVR